MTNLKLYMARGNIRQTDIARATGLHRKRIGKLVRGQSQPRPEEKRLLSQALGVDAKILFGNSNLVLPGEMTLAEIKQLVEDLMEDERAALRVQSLAGGAKERAVRNINLPSHLAQEGRNVSGSNPLL